MKWPLNPSYMALWEVCTARSYLSGLWPVLTYGPVRIFKSFLQVSQEKFALQKLWLSFARLPRAGSAKGTQMVLANGMGAWAKQGKK